MITINMDNLTTPLHQYAKFFSDPQIETKQIAKMKKRMDNDKVEKCKLVADAKTFLWCLCSMNCTIHVTKTRSSGNNTNETIYQK